MTYLKFFVNGLTPDLLKRTEEELGETDEIRNRSLEEIKILINDEPDFFPCTDDVFLLAFLRAKKFNVSIAFKTLKSFYKAKARNSGVLTDFTPFELKSCFEQPGGAILEYRGQVDSSAGYIRPAASDIKKFTLEQNVAATILFSYFLIQNEATQVTGHSIIIDFNGFSWRFLVYYFSPSLIYKMMNIIVNAFPIRIKSIHVINAATYTDVICTLVLSLMPEKLRSRVHFHGNDFKSLHKFITPDILPEEYGGMQGPILLWEKKFINTILSLEEHYIKMNEYGFKGKTLENIQKKK